MNFLLYCILAFLGFYSIAFCLHLLETVSVFIFYFPLYVIFIYEPTLSALINAILIAILLLSTFTITKTSLQTKNGTCLHIPSYVIMLLCLNIIVSLVLPPSMPAELSIELVPAIILWAPIYEEFFFRFLLIVVPIAIISKRPRITIRGKNTINKSDLIFITVSSLLFGFSHQVYGLGAILIATITGIVIGLISIRCGILASINMHFLFNTLVAATIVALCYAHFFIILLILFSIILLIILGIATFVITFLIVFESLIIKKH